MRILAVSNLGPRAVSPHEGIFLPPRMRGIEAGGHRTALIKPEWSGVAINLAERLRARSFSRPPPLDHAALDPAWRVVVTSIRPWEVPSGVFGDPVAATDRIAASIAEYCGGERYDVIQAHGMYAFWAGGVAEHLSRRLGVPYTVTFHGSDLNAAKARRSNAFRRITGGALGTMYVSGALRDQARQRGLVGRASAVTPNGFDGSLFHPVGRSTSDRLRVLFVGNLLPVKGADRLPEILRALRRLEPRAELTIVGDGPLRKSLEAALDGSGTRLAGWLEPARVADAMRRADVLVVPSRSEGWGCVITEARACGTPVAATAVGGIPEALGSGGEMVAASPFDPAAMAAAIVRQRATPDPHRTAAEAEPYNWRSLGEQEVAVLSRWMGSHR
jgi:glycosyltransferase involved in cell wall biosynthesis